MMKSLKLLIVAFAACLSLCCSAMELEAENILSFYNKTYLGEVNPGLYVGPTDPLFCRDPYQGEVVWQENAQRRVDFYSQFFHYFRDTDNFINSELIEAQSCPNALLGEQFSYLRYLYRLITLSYLYESVLYYEANLSREHSNHKCQVDWVEAIKSCAPESQPMKKFVTNAKSYVHRHHRSNVEKIKLEQEVELGQILTTESGHFLSRRVKKYCEQTNLDECSRLKKNGHKVVEKVCQKDLKLFKYVCREGDRLYGISNVALAYYLLSESNVVHSFESEALGIGCLQRFSQLTSTREKKFDQLELIFPFINYSLKKQFDDRFVQGRLFVLGALREFEQKGLDDIFAVKVQEQDFQKQNEKPKIEPQEKIAKPQKSDTPPEKTPPVVAVSEKKTPIKKRIRKSAFLLASEILEKFNWDRVKVNMQKFQYDFVFKHEQLEHLNETMPNFVSRKVLDEMKKHDSLGQRKGPVPLIFIKYLIESDQHQGLYNIINTIGNRFYVRNNVDKKELVKGVDYIELINDTSTNNRWQIYILTSDTDGES